MAKILRIRDQQRPWTMEELEQTALSRFTW
jgi:hypothetical protein